MFVACLSMASLFLSKVDAWVVAPCSSSASSASIGSVITSSRRRLHHRTSSRTPTALSAGFGASASNKKKEIKLKPKQQWDRYIALKKETSYKVAVRPAGGADADTGDNWLEVGAVKSQGSDKTAFAVARQRALIAEVGLFLLACSLALRWMVWSVLSIFLLAVYWLLRTKRFDDLLYSHHRVL